MVHTKKSTIYEKSKKRWSNKKKKNKNNYLKKNKKTVTTSPCHPPTIIANKRK